MVVPVQTRAQIPAVSGLIFSAESPVSSLAALCTVSFQQLQPIFCAQQADCILGKTGFSLYQQTFAMTLAAAPCHMTSHACCAHIQAAFNIITTQRVGERAPRTANETQHSSLSGTALRQNCSEMCINTSYQNRGTMPVLAQPYRKQHNV